MSLAGGGGEDVLDFEISVEERLAAGVHEGDGLGVSEQLWKRYTPRRHQ